MKRSGASKGAAQRWLRATPLFLAMACGGPQELGGAGAKCFRDDECELGLICVAPMEGDHNRVCSDDPTPLISNVDGPPVAEPMGGSAGAMAAGGMGAVAGAGATSGGGMGAAAGAGAMAGAGATAGSGGTGGTGGTGGSDTAGSGGTGGNGGSDSAGSAGTGGSSGSGGTEPEGGAPM